MIMATKWLSAVIRSARWSAIIVKGQFARLATLVHSFPVITTVSGLGATVYVGAYVYAQTEHDRMANQIISRKLNGCETTTSLKNEFCQVDLKEIERILDQESFFAGIVGVKSSGKTSALKLLSDRRANVVYVNMPLDEKRVLDRLYQMLRKSVWTFPTCFDKVRSEVYSDPEYVVTQVFSRVQKKTGRPVTTVIDIVPGSGKETPNYKARAFVREIKFLVSDKKLMRCVFASSEGTGFQIEARREPRLKLLITHELPIDSAVSYIKEVTGTTVSDDVRELLLKFPRTFSNAPCVLAKVILASEAHMCNIDKAT